jgi:hypothetical protein
MNETTQLFHVPQVAPEAPKRHARPGPQIPLQSTFRGRNEGDLLSAEYDFMYNFAVSVHAVLVLCSALTVACVT